MKRKCAFLLTGIPPAVRRYISCSVLKRISLCKEGETAGFEAVSDGRQHAVICHVEPADAYPSLEASADAKKAEPIFFDPASMTVEYREIRMDYTHRWVNGVLQKFPYDKLYDSPYMTSAYGSGVLHLTDGEESAVLDFNF